MNSCMAEADRGDHESADLFRALDDVMGRGNVFKREDASERQRAVLQPRTVDRLVDLLNVLKRSLRLHRPAPD